jgi:hypothetical protein
MAHVAVVIAHVDKVPSTLDIPLPALVRWPHQKRGGAND